MRRPFLLSLGALAFAMGCASSSASSLPPLTDRTGDGARSSSSALESSNKGPGQPLVFQVKRYPDNSPYDLKSDRGQVVLLDVWATWCEPCKDALPMYAQLQKEYGSRGFKAYALNVDEDVRAIPPFLEEAKVEVPILLDANALVSERLLKVRLMPTTFLIDRKGVIRHVHEGFAEEFLQQFQTEIEQLLAEPAS
ncbi:MULTISPECIES: TlpA family protein disulfide reductase [unclassified Corallococcus]|uniref:TlpA family protein disulfide reductase n=1 Tax=unclassified Corallococcus TaxID=2685029 RepID=UPI001A902B8A|nr:MULTISPECIES: TlpA disulfide reductase family protein [unclassified Corallococcus]MBN9687355.1 TlpA family protein disulfide reductase [Corallococcus sp. NCSPR001]WAS88823.1 TlpA disulfide reductase family protein [Corallococcus sp. NCRR]